MKISSSKKGRVVKNKKGKGKRVIAAISFLVVIAVVLIGLGFGTGGDNALVPIDPISGKINVLLLGVDEGGLRSDAIMVASYDFDDESLKILSIPRDTKIYVTNRKLYRKINEVHAMTKKNGEIMGPLASVEAVTALTGIPINYYVELNFSAIDHIFDILGPVTFDVPDVEGGGKGMNYDDPVQDLHIHLKPGLQELSGNQVQQFLRFRKSNHGTTDGSDTSRVERQQEFIKAVIEQKVNLSLIVKVPDIYSQMKKEIKTNFSTGEIAKYAAHLLNLSSENITSFSLPGEDKLTGAWYFECDFEATKSLIETEFEYDASNITNKIEITGEKFKSSKASKTEAPKDNAAGQTAKPQKTATTNKSTNEPAGTQKPTQKPATSPGQTNRPDETEKPSKTAEATSGPAEKTETPKKTEAPVRTAEPSRPTPKPTQQPADDDEPIMIDD